MIKKINRRNFIVDIIIFFLIFSMILGSPIYRGSNISILIFMNLLLLLTVRGFNSITKKTFYLVIYVTIIYLITIINSVDKSMTTYFYFTIIFFILNYINLYEYFKIDSKNFYKILNLISLFGNAVILYSIIEYKIHYNPIFCNFFPEPYSLSYSIPNNIFYRVNGSVGQPVPYASFTLFMVFINYLQFKVKNKKKYLVFSFLAIIAMIFTYTRSAYIALTLGILIVSLIYKSKNLNSSFKNMIIGIVFSIVIFILLILILNNKNEFFMEIFNRFNNISEDLSFTQRAMGINFVRESLSSNIVNLIFGFGVGSLLNIRRYYNIIFLIDGFYALDNQYFTILFEFGIIGAVIIVMYLKRFFKILIRHINNCELKILSACLISLLICQFFYDATYWIITLFMISINISMIRYIYLNKEE